MSNMFWKPVNVSMISEHPRSQETNKFIRLVITNLESYLSTTKGGKFEITCCIGRTKRFVATKVLAKNILRPQ